MIDEEISMEHWWHYTDRGKMKYSGETCPIVTWHTTNPTWNGMGLKLPHPPGLQHGHGVVIANE